MDKVDLPTGTPSEPENASQPEAISSSIRSMASQSQELLSQPPDELTQFERMLWYQERRIESSLWVQCDSCNKWRHIMPNVYERHQLPDKWFCKLHPVDGSCPRLWYRSIYRLFVHSGFLQHPQKKSGKLREQTH
ncbi:unnamed protein product [Pieris macdunnoughi]|uniref:CW-type domain-containing protein n=1 Tax=Pieris macdunnoughi TaxID=345717 RepID=A0A821X8N2_9NEOP|nr:unnamed protein product [Pieris macdunnoughi]